jgi:hypothetical protein
MSNPGQAIVGVVGGIIGGLITMNPMGAVKGFSMGLMLGGMLFPTKGEDKEYKAHPAGLMVSTSAYGVTIPVVFGTREISGNMIWPRVFDGTTFKNTEHVTEEESGGKGGGGGGGGASTTTYTYTVSCAYGLGFGPLTVLRVWAGKHLIDSADYTVSSSAFTAYDGTQTTPDPTIAAITSPAPVWKNFAYVVFKDYDLGESPQLPNFTFEVSSDPSVVVTTLTWGAAC